MNADSIAFLLDEIHQFNAELGRLSGKPPLGAPGGGVTDAAVAAFASAQGLVFPPSYAEFLRSHAGWNQFFNGVTLIGAGGPETKFVLKRFEAAKIAQKMDLKTLLGDVSPDTLMAWRRRIPRNVVLEEMGVLGTDGIGFFLLFDLPRRGADGEMAVISWDLSYGALEAGYFRNFHAYLIHVRNELDKERIAAVKAARKKK